VELVGIRIEVKSWIWIHIKVKCWIRIRKIQKLKIKPLRAVDAHNGCMEAQNGALEGTKTSGRIADSHHFEEELVGISIEVKSWIRIHIKVKCWIRIRIKVIVSATLGTTQGCESETA
jgi:hypothetical protein